MYSGSSSFVLSSGLSSSPSTTHEFPSCKLARPEAMILVSKARLESKAIKVKLKTPIR